MKKTQAEVFVVNNTRLKPRPFCNSQAKIIKTSEDLYYAECPTCEIATKWSQDIEMVISIWNSRPGI
jgi:endogenous inhibitor of DNA gyrase (YacG/DUF329 family)